MKSGEVEVVGFYVFWVGGGWEEELREEDRVLWWWWLLICVSWRVGCHRRGRHGEVCRL